MLVHYLETVLIKKYWNIIHQMFLINTGEYCLPFSRVVMSMLNSMEVQKRLIIILGVHLWTNVSLSKEL